MASAGAATETWIATEWGRFLQNARRYAAILKLDPQAFPSLMKRGPRAHLLEPPSSQA